MWEKLRSGDWLTAERLRAYPLLLLSVLGLAAIVVVATARDRMGPNNLPLGSDFSQVWIAGREVLDGRPEAPFDIRTHASAQRAEFGEKADVFGWLYPPYFLAPAALLARLPYLQALALWQFGTVALYLLSILALLGRAPISRGAVVIAALGFPAVFVNLGHGQNGFLTAALLGWGFFLLERRPWIAGALFGALAYKPHFALALPLALCVCGRWRALTGAAATLLALTGATILLFGLSSWSAFIQSLGFTRAVVELGAPGFEKIQSVFAVVRMFGGSIGAAYFWQGLTTAGALAALAWLLRSQADARVKAAGTIVATFLTTPYMLDYDMVALAPALALLLSHGLDAGFRPYEKSILAFAYAAPLVARPVATYTSLPLGVLSVLLLFASTARQAVPAEKQTASPRLGLQP